MKFLCAICCLWLLAWPLHAVEVVAHASVSEQRLSTSQLRAIFTMRQTRWADGQLIQVFVLHSEHEQHLLFSRNYLKMFPYQLDAIWARQRYSGIGSFPIQVTSLLEMQQRLQQTPGAIGYLTTDLMSSDLNVVAINEK
ncbi:hypothetical protein [Alishewanella tabrizica]|nr:hypothetical protein [Alishewanella tabrizica]